MNNITLTEAIERELDTLFARTNADRESPQYITVKDISKRTKLSVSVLRSIFYGGGHYKFSSIQRLEQEGLISPIKHLKN